jgi:mannose-6-phosphate isomerase class I
MPGRPTDGIGQYNIYPVHQIPPGRIALGHAALAALLGGEATTTGRTITIDGCAGVIWDELRTGLTAAWAVLGLTSEWVDVAGALEAETEIEHLTAPYLGGDDPVFGTAFNGSLADFFDPAKLAQLAPSGGADVTVLYGSGAALADWDSLLVWVDVPKNEIQYRARAGQGINLGTSRTSPPKVAYKRSYFVDWPVTKRHFQALLPGIDALVDQQRPTEPTAISGEHLRQALADLSRQPIRARPWFEPGAWGGQWLKHHIPGLAPDVPNYAWSFELIAPENGIVLRSDTIALEVPFDTLLLFDSAAILGESATRFGTEFPIRFDFLDTFDGGNLSLQVHPEPAYIRQRFGERFTQDETYYILDRAPGAQVYLGFQEGIDPARFRVELEASAQTGQPVDVERFVLTHPAAKHDLFLIPHGTIHCSGVGNLVLEISATPYIFTFKLYDWLRLDLDGQARPLNIERGFANLDFTRQGDQVVHQLISRPEVVAEGPGWREVNLPTHDKHFYQVRRLEFGPGGFDLPTRNSVQVMSLVEGGQVTVRAGGCERTFHYAETFIIPAAAGQMRLTADQPVKVIAASVKPGRGPL